MNTILNSLFLPFFILWALVGCNDVPVKASNAKPVPAEQILGKPKVTYKSPSKMVLVRDSGVPTRGTALIKCDGKELAKFEIEERLDVYVDPGTHILAVKTWDTGFTEIETILHDSETAYFRISATGRQLSLKRTA